MASIRTRTSAAGATTHRVLFRHAGKQTSRTFETLQAARRWARLVDQVGADQALAMLEASSPAATVAPTLEQWLEHHLDHSTGVAIGTRTEYRRLAARTWLPMLGAIPVDFLTRDDVARWVGKAASSRGRSGRLLAAKTIANAHGLLSAVVSSAVAAGLRADNPCRGVRLPAGRTAEMVFLTRERYDELVAAIPEDWQPFVAFMAGTGLRWSEATALTWADLDLDGPSPAVRVTKAWKRADGTGQTYELGPPKTARGVRTVTLPAHVADALRRIRDEARPPRAQLVFRAAQGGQLRHQNWHPRVWLPAVALAGLEPPPRIHDLRHSHVSWLIAAGVPLPVIQRRIGHESIKTTVDVYGHLDRHADSAAAAAVDLAMSSPGRPQPETRALRAVR